MQLLSTPTYVESPFIIVKIGEYTFGQFSKGARDSFGYYRVSYPNYMKSMQIVKINGSINRYTINMEYPITQFDDPNLLERVLSSISENRKIKVSYGDWNAPSFIYREESALVTNVITRMDASNARINYTITATSDSLQLNASRINFEPRVAKPSDVIYELLYSRNYGLLDVFYGMTSESKVRNLGLIPVDDKKVTIEAKNSVSLLEYLNYLVSCMVPSDAKENTTGLTDSSYYLHIEDDVKNDLGGPYFQITEVRTNTNTYNKENTYELDVGFPGKNLVTSFSVNNDQSWSILYNYGREINDTEKSYRIDDNGNVIGESEPDLARSRNLNVITQANKNWWSKVTGFPITATVTIKGLLVPAILMSQVYVNVLFYGKRHISSGLYIITKHEDTIDANGYKSTLTLLRISGDVVK